MISQVRVTARIEDVLDVEHDEDATEDEIREYALQDWQFVEAMDFEAELT